MRTHIILFLICLGWGTVVFAQPDRAEKVLREAYQLDGIDPLKAIEKAKEAYDIALEEDTPSICSRALAYHARIRMFEGDYKTGFSLYYDALDYCPPDSLSIIADIYSGLSWGCIELNNKEKALSFINKSIDLYQQLGDSTGVAVSYNYKGYVYYKTLDYKEADRYYNYALAIFRQQDDKRNIAAVINNLCQTPANNQSKIDLIKEGIQLNQTLNNIWSVSENYNTLGRQYYFQHRYNDAILALDQGNKYALKINSKNLLAENYEIRAQIFSAQKDYAMAYIMLQKQMDMEKAVRSEKNMKEVEQNLSYQDLLKLRQEYELKQKEQDVRMLRKNLMIWIVAMTLVVMLILMRFLSYKRKKQLELMAQQYKLEQSQRELMEADIKKKESTIDHIDHKLQSAKEKLAIMQLFLSSRNELLEKIRDMIRESYKMDPAKQMVHLKNTNTFIAQYQIKEEEMNELVPELEEQNLAFVQRLEQLYPSVTASEKKLAVLLRMNISTKEISLITGNSIKTISMTRYRLRKHIELLPDEDIVAFLQKI